MKVSVIVTTYNRPDALAAVLHALAAQTDHDFEVRVADDGSGPQTRGLVQQIASTFPVPLSHVWQEDLGFRAGAARNRACAQAQGEYLVFLDGDCVPLPDFVAQHRALADARWFVAGNRILLSPGFTALALGTGRPLHAQSTLYWLWARLRGHINRLSPLLRLGNAGG